MRPFDMDFTLSKYEELLNFLKDKGYGFHSVSDYLEEDPDPPLVILRHDVDRQKKNALKMAELEEDNNVSSTYYFRYPKTFDTKVIDKVSEKGHEVGYHYEVLSKADGDFKEAVKLFAKELENFRKVYDVKTICMHGAPLSDFDNQDIVDHIEFDRFGLLGDAVSSLTDKKLMYFTDTGRRWDEKYNIRDRVPLGKKAERPIKTTDELMDFIENSRFGKLYINVHPERWNDNVVMWIYKYILDVAYNHGKKLMNRNVT